MSVVQEFAILYPKEFEAMQRMTGPASEHPIAKDAWRVYYAFKAGWDAREQWRSN